MEGPTRQLHLRYRLQNMHHPRYSALRLPSVSFALQRHQTNRPVAIFYNKLYRPTIMWLSLESTSCPAVRAIARPEHYPVRRFHHLLRFEPLQRTPTSLHTCMHEVNSPDPPLCLSRSTQEVPMYVVHRPGHNVSEQAVGASSSTSALYSSRYLLIAFYRLFSSCI